MAEGLVHRPVLLHEAVQALALAPDACCIDATFGRGGHSAAILARLGPRGRLVALDRDPEAVAWGRERLGGDERLQIIQGAFGRLADTARELEIEGKVNAVLFDLGVSSPQLDDADRGFSFQRAGPLDMRMDPTAGPSAADWLAEAPEAEIARVLWEYGEERHARRIARAIVAERARAPLDTTDRLAALVARVVPGRRGGKHPATRTFQAIRIHVNRELDELKAGLEGALRVLAPGGRMVVISFHSLEDRMVKRFFREHARGERPPRGIPVRDAELQPGPLRLVGRAVRPGGDEVAVNPRARSAVMRVAEKRA